MNTLSAKLIVATFLLGLTSAAQVNGTGTGNFVARWLDADTLGNSKIFQTSGKIGVGTTSPTAALHVAGPSATAGANALPVLNVFGGAGGDLLNFGFAGAGANIQFVSGRGGNNFGGGGTGAIIQLTGGGGGGCLAASTRCGSIGGSGGSITMQPGAGGVGGIAGRTGNILMVRSGGRVAIGVSTARPTATLDVAPGGTTLADAWSVRSSSRFKTNIRPLTDAINVVQRLRGVSYDSKRNGKHEIGVIAEEVDKILPEIVSRDANTDEVQGVDYARLTALLIEAVKSQQAEIEQLKKTLRTLPFQPQLASSR
jgi:Chaperone of endosialidase